MKKLIVIGIAALLCSSCQFETGPYGTLMDKINGTKTVSEQVPESTPVVMQTEPITPQADPSTPKLAHTKYASDADRYRQNIVVKVIGEDYIVYEYSDVRIDDIATLASAFCYETDPDKKAYLRDIYMYKNHKRRATFDCVNLASK